MSTVSPLTPEENVDDEKFDLIASVPESERSYIAKIQSLHQLKRSFEFAAVNYWYRINAAIALFSRLLASDDTKYVNEARESSQRYFRYVDSTVKHFDELGLVGADRQRRENELLRELLDRNMELYEKYSGLFREPNPRASKPERLVEASIYLGGSADENDADKVFDALSAFAEMVGIRRLDEVEKIVGSIFKRFLAFLRKDKTKNEIDALYSDGKESLRARYLNKPRSETTKNLADAAAALLTAIDGHDNAILRLGELIVVKQTINGFTNIAIETISPELASKLEDDPELLRNPQRLLSMIPPECVTRIKTEESVAFPTK